jgi:hypothetical protein
MLRYLQWVFNPCEAVSPFALYHGRVGVRKYLNSKHATDSHYYENPKKLKIDNLPATENCINNAIM